MTKTEALHAPVNAGPDDEDDFRYCGDCGTDLYSLSVCPEAPLDACGCPLYMTRTGDHFPGSCALEEG